MVAFAPNGDVYIAEGHGNESPNDTDSEDPANNSGASRIIHIDKNGKFKNQWFGNEVGQGKFNSAHGLAVDPTTGDVWIGDREDYRIVVYSGDGKFLKTMQMRNLVCALYFDSKGNPWMGSGQDGQFLKLTRDGKVIGAIGNGMGIGHGQFIEASYWVMDKQDNLYAGDTSVGRVTKMVATEEIVDSFRIEFSSIDRCLDAAVAGFDTPDRQTRLPERISYSTSYLRRSLHDRRESHRPPHVPAPRSHGRRCVLDALAWSIHVPQRSRRTHCRPVRPRQSEARRDHEAPAAATA